MYKGYKNYKKRFDYAKTAVRILKFSIFVACAVLLILNLQIFPKLSSLAHIAATNRINSIIQEAVSEYLANSTAEHDELVSITYDCDGNVTSLQSRTKNLNSVRNSLAKYILDRLSDEDIMKVKIPLGSIIGGSFLSGKGPGITVRLASAQKYGASLVSSFEEMGINQTRHIISMDFSVTMLMLLPGRNFSVSVDDTYQLCETVIVGKVPDTYTKIHRLTDDISEEIIDDIYDFGYVN